MRRFTENERHGKDQKFARVRGLYADARDFQRSVSEQWAFSQSDLQSIDEFQERLIEEIRGIAPNQAESLRLLLDRLNFNHLACLIYITDRTKWLVFNEFMRRVGEIVEDF
jgi:hypothetical protein